MFSQKIQFFQATKIPNTSRRLVFNPMARHLTLMFRGVTNFRVTHLTLIAKGPRMQGVQGDEGIRATKLSQVLVATTGMQLLLGTQAILVEEVGTRVQPTKAVGQGRTYKCSI